MSDNSDIAKQRLFYGAYFCRNCRKHVRIGRLVKNIHQEKCPYCKRTGVLRPILSYPKDEK